MSSRAAQPPPAELDQWNADNQRARDAAYNEPHETLTRDKPKARNGKGGEEMARRYWLTEKGYRALAATKVGEGE